MSKRFLLKPTDEIVDLFCGGGGASVGILKATGRHPSVAINHWDYAIDVHSLNHPTTVHIQDDLNKVNPRKVLPGQRIGLLWASPSCTKHSSARGKAKGVDDPFDRTNSMTAEERATLIAERQLRSQPWIITKWIRLRQPEIVFMENVDELLAWQEQGEPAKGELGADFLRWIWSIKAHGYSVEWKLIAADDHGAITSRPRLYLIARRDGQPIRWPEPIEGVHGTALDCINWKHKNPSILDRERPLADSTTERLIKGFMRYVVNPERRVMLPAKIEGLGGKGHEFAGWLVKNYTGVLGGSLNQPIGTITTKDHHGLGVVQLADLKTCDTSRANRAYGYICQYYSDGGQWQGLDKPLLTITTRDRFALATVLVNGRTKVVEDIGYRMLQPDELAHAQGFPKSYKFIGSKADQCMAIGNSVVSHVAAAIISANVTTNQEAA